MIENVATEFGKKYAQNVDIKNPEPGSFFSRTEENIQTFLQRWLISYYEHNQSISCLQFI